MRRHPVSDDQKTDRWLVSYADFITLLLAFFVVMYSISQVNEGKYRVLAESLLAAFKGPERSMQPINEGEVNRRKEPILGRDNSLPGVESSGDEPLVTKQASEGELAVLNATAQQSQEEFQQLAENLAQALSPLTEKGLLQINATEDWIELDFPSGLLFTSGSDVLSPSAQAVLQQVATVLKKTTNLIRVRGFTDSQPVGGRFQSNWALSAARAVAVVQLLQGNAIEPERLAIEGYGEYAPIADNETPEGRARNRRVVIAISRYVRGERTPLPLTDDETSQERNHPEDFEIIRGEDGRLIIRGRSTK
ncbi:MAG: flagellar motor protein MotD [Gammaproteobacteria bacterium]|nr:MAG: flagellar motor protein MotD [Gammaproteobacteria bacterium]